MAIEAEAALWEPCGAGALAYLRGRGYSDDTIRRARLGYLHHDRRESPEAWGLPSEHRLIWVPSGIVIPWRALGSLWRLNVRRLAGKPKYVGPAGARNGLYGADGVPLYLNLPVVLVEGELDALAVAQAAGDLVTAVASGSTHGARHARWRRLLARARLVLVAYDDDEAGEQAAGWWLDRLPRVRRLVPDGDPAAMLAAAVDLREWLLRALSGDS